MITWLLIGAAVWLALAVIAVFIWVCVHAIDADQKYRRDRE